MIAAEPIHPGEHLAEIMEPRRAATTRFGDLRWDRATAPR